MWQDEYVLSDIFQLTKCSDIIIVYHHSSFVDFGYFNDFCRNVSDSFWIKILPIFIQAHIAIHVYSLVDRNTLKQLPDVNEDKVDKSK